MPRDNAGMELAELNGLKRSLALSNLIEEHKRTIQEEIHRLVRHQEFTAAYGAVCKLDNINVIYKLINAKIQQIEKEEK